MGSPLGIFSAWIQLHKYQDPNLVGDVYRTIFWEGIGTSPNPFSAWIRITPDNAIEFLFRKMPLENSLVVLHMKSGNNSTPLGIGENNWLHILASWNLTGGSFAGGIYINDILDLTPVSIYSPGNVAWSDDYSTLKYLFAARSGSSVARHYYNGLIGQLYLNTAEYLDFSLIENRRKFISSTRQYVYLGSGGQLPTGLYPQYYFHGTLSGENQIDPYGDQSFDFFINRGVERSGNWGSSNVLFNDYTTSSPYELPGYL